MLILLTRHGESEYNLENKIGGDPKLSTEGVKYAQKLNEFCQKNDWVPKKCITSTKKRAIETCSYLEEYMNSIDQYSDLDEINGGIAEHLTYEEFASKYPEETLKRKENKLSYRYPEGESYEDLIKRTQKIAHNVLDKKEDIVIVAHRAIIRALIHHFLGTDKNIIPTVDIPLHKIIMIKNEDMFLVDV